MVWEKQERMPKYFGLTTHIRDPEVQDPVLGLAKVWSSMLSGSERIVEMTLSVSLALFVNLTSKDKRKERRIEYFKS